MINETIHDVIFVGLPGPTHHYGGLSGDNVASNANQGSESRPREAALQALGLAKLLRSLGMHTAILPPQLRPYTPLLHAIFQGDDAAVIRQAAKEKPRMLEMMSSSAAMWVANAATTAPGIDCQDGKLHLSTANLHRNLHRRLEARDTWQTLRAIFAHVPDAMVHAPLSPEQGFDEGAANHMRLAPSHREAGLNIFVYGSDGHADDPPTARQSQAASEAVAHQQGILHPLFVKQRSSVIQQGVFHNDVIAISNENLLLAHERAYAGGADDIERIRQAYDTLHPDKPLHILLISEEQFSVGKAVASYFFNSQIITLPDSSMAIIAPLEVKLLFGGKGAALMEDIRRDPTNPITQVEYVDLRQSMRNGGGPACLRLRVPMTGAQLAAIKNSVNVLADDALLASLAALVEKYYPQTLQAAGLGDPALYFGCKALLEEMGQVMKLPLLNA